MIHSMTAYGRVENSEGQNSISCEIRSVNHRYSEISIRLPEELRPLEQKIRDHISGKIKRGDFIPFGPFICISTFLVWMFGSGFWYKLLGNIFWWKYL